MVCSNLVLWCVTRGSIVWFFLTRMEQHCQDVIHQLHPVGHGAAARRRPWTALWWPTWATSMSSCPTRRGRGTGQRASLVVLKQFSHLLSRERQPRTCLIHILSRNRPQKSAADTHALTHTSHHMHTRRTYLPVALYICCDNIALFSDKENTGLGCFCSEQTLYLSLI